MTPSLFRPLGGWTPDRQVQLQALRNAAEGVEGASIQLAQLGVPEADRCVQHVSELARMELSPDHLDDICALLAQSPDPAAVSRALVTLLDQPHTNDLGREALTAFAAISSQSRFLARYLARRPAALVRLVESGALAEARSRDEFDGLGQQCLLDHATALRAGDTETFAEAIRDLRRLELARIFYREVVGLAQVDITCLEVADLASALIQAAYSAAKLASTGAEDHAGDLLMSIIGMGKLGSRELNFSSDIDILFVAGDEVLADPDLARFGELVARRTRDLLDAPMSNGRVFRVDLRLRPDGSRGPLIAFPRGLRDYYDRLARTWERAALLRARVVAGEPEPGREALRLIEPFRYPKSVDASVVEDLRAMKDRIDRHESWRSTTRRIASGWDSKVGRGGIREVEFVVAAFQYLLAGRRPELRDLSTFDGVGRIAAAGFLHPADANDLVVAYRFYRQLEHRLQMDEDRQTQRLPTDPTEQRRLARRLGFADWAALDHRLEEHRSRVREIFERTLASHPEAPSPKVADHLLDSLSALMTGNARREEVLSAMSAAGFNRPRSALGALQVLWKQPRGPFSASVLRSADRLPAYLLDAALQSPDPDAAVIHLTDLLTHPHAGASVNFLRAKPATLRSVMTLFGASDFLARRLARNPLLIDRLLSSPRVLQSRVHLEEAWERVGRRETSLERRLDLLRRFHAGQVVRIALAYLEDVLDDRQLGDQLTLLAEFTVDAVLTEARLDLGHPETLAEFAVIGAGRLGGLEMGFGSDLDLIFVFDDQPDAAPRYGRLARRLIHFLNMPMPGGILYHVDLRLRPYGADGTVVTTLDRFADYYAHRADAWERIALLRSRPVAGAPEVARRFHQILDRVIVPPPEDIGSTIRRIDEIRGRLLAEVARPTPGSYHLKYGSGGLIEIELVAQIRRLVRRTGQTADAVAGSRGPGPRLLDVLAWLKADGTLPEADADQLATAYAFYRRLQNVLRLTQDRSLDQFSPADPATKRVHQLLGRHHPRLAEPVVLEETLQESMSAVRRIYERYIRQLTPGDNGRGHP